MTKGERKIKYEPRNVKDILVDMKDTSELMVDLAYSAILYENQEIAAEVLELEETMNIHRYHAHIALMLAARKPKEAEELVGVVHVVNAAEKISNAAEDIASILTRDIGLPNEIRSALPEAKEVVFRAEVDEESNMAGYTLDKLNLETDTGVHIIAIRRDTDWIFDPDRNTQILRGDVIFGEGPERGVENVYERATRKESGESGIESTNIEDLDKAVTALIDMKNMSELAVGLAYSAALLDSEDIAGEVQVLESKTDELRANLESWVLESARNIDDPDKLRGLIHIAISSEVIADAALEMADAVIRDVELHPVLKEAIRESNEVIASVKVKSDSNLLDQSLGAIRLESDTGMFVMAIRRGDDWVYNPDSDTVIKKRDALIVRGPRAGLERLHDMAG